MLAVPELPLQRRNLVPQPNCNDVICPVLCSCCRDLHACYRGRGKEAFTVSQAVCQLDRLLVSCRHTLTHLHLQPVTDLRQAIGLLLASGKSSMCLCQLLTQLEHVCGQLLLVVS